MKRFTDLDGALLSEKFIRILQGVANRSLERLTEARAFIPDFKLRIDVSTSMDRTIKRWTRYFTCIDRRKKGKCRVYGSFNDMGPLLFMFFISPKTIRKLSSKYDSFDEKVKQKLVNRWVITEGTHDFKCLKQLIFHIVAIERVPKKTNRPPCGSNRQTWTRGSSFMDNNMKNEHSIICNEKIYGMELEPFSLEKEIFNGLS